MNVGFAPAWRQIVEVLRLSHNGRVIGRFCRSRFVLSNYGIAT